MLGSKKVEIVSKPIEIDIMQPDLPRPVELTAPQWFVVSEARIANPCKKVKQEDGSEKRPKACAKEDTENPDWPEGYTYLDRFLDEMKEQNNDDLFFNQDIDYEQGIRSPGWDRLQKKIKKITK